MPLMNQIIWGGICLSSKYAPVEIHNIMFLPLDHTNFHGGRHQTTLSFVIKRYSAPLLYIMPQGQNFFWGGDSFSPFRPNSAPDENLSAL